MNVPELAQTAGDRIAACRFCGGRLGISFCDLGATPLANSYVPPEHAGTPDPVFPLRAMACDACQLVQLDHTADATGIFSDYAYFSSFSSTWLTHAARPGFHDRIALADGPAIRNWHLVGAAIYQAYPGAGRGGRSGKTLI